MGLKIRNPKSAKPIVCAPQRVATWGVPTEIRLLGGHAVMGIDLRPSTTSALYPNYTGTFIAEYDWVNMTTKLIARLPNYPSISFPEGSIDQTADGRYIYVARVETGAAISRADRLSGPWSTPVQWTALGGITPDTRTRAIVTPNGNLIVVWNDNHTITGNIADRNNLTIGISIDNGVTILNKVLLSGGNSGIIAYPDINVDPDTGDIIVIHDRNRGTIGQIVMNRVSETSLLNGVATPVATSISILGA